MYTTTSAPRAQQGPDGLALIGSTRHQIMGIRYTEGEGGGAGAGGEGGQGGEGGNGGENNVPWTSENFDPERAGRLVANLRKDLDDHRAKSEAAIAAAAEKAQKDTLAQFAKLLGGGEQEETDPEKLKAKVTDLSTQIAEKDTNLTKAQADLKARDVSLAVAMAAPTLGANTKLLLANEEFKTSIASVEPGDEAAITAAITKALQANAALKQPPPRSGAGEHTGPTVQSLEAQLKKAEEEGNVRESIRLKRSIAAARASTQ